MIFLAPTRWLAIALVTALLLATATYQIATHLPWLGINFKPAANETGIVVASIDAQSPNAQLAVGAVVVALAAGGRTEPLYGYTLYEGNIDLSSFDIFNRFVAHHRAVWEILKQGEFEFVLADGQRIPGHAAAQRPGTDLSWRFWFLVATGMVTFIIGAAIWAFRRESVAARLVLIGASGYTYAALLAALHYSRELTLPPFWFYIGIGDNNVGVEIISYSMLALFWEYPKPLSRFPASRFFVALVVMICANEMLQLIEWPGHAYVMQYPFAFGAMAVLALIQWRRVRHDALARASLQWFLLTILTCASLVVVLFFGPIAYTGKPIMPAVVIYLLGPLLYLGLAFGIARYRLFDLDRWWLEVWLWLAGGALVIGIDALLVTFFNLMDLLALGFALIIAGWLYLPLRQWLFRRVLRSARTRIDSHLPVIVDTLFNEASPATFSDRWRDLLGRVFAPMTFTVLTMPLAQAEIAESGVALRVSSLDGNDSFELRYREKGSQLYSPRDAALADTLLALTCRTAAMWQAREDAARTERTRIARDLHDDVAARLLSLVHRVPEISQQVQVREAIGALRFVIYALDDQQPITFGDFLNEAQAQLRELLRGTGIELHWHEPATLPVVTLSPRERINLARVVQEGAANAIRHAHPLLLRVCITLTGKVLQVSMCNDGSILQPKDWHAGKGVHNIRTRMHEIGGEVEWNVPPENSGGDQTCCLEVNVPLSGLK